MSDETQSAGHEFEPTRTERADPKPPKSGLADLHMTEHEARRRTTLAVEGLARAAARLAIVAASIDAKLTAVAEAADHEDAETERHFRPSPCGVTIDRGAFGVVGPCERPHGHDGEHRVGLRRWKS